MSANIHSSFIFDLKLLSSLTDLKHLFQSVYCFSASLSTHTDFLALPSILQILDTSLPALTSSGKKSIYTPAIQILCLCARVFFTQLYLFSVRVKKRKKKKDAFHLGCFQLMPFTRLCRTSAQTFLHRQSWAVGSSVNGLLPTCC